MLRFIKENKCRFCTQIFCCVQCRIQHEVSDHSVNLECNICMYGRTVIRNPSRELLNHIKSCHLPLRCSYCKKICSSIKELLVDKCPIPKYTSETPVQNKVNMKIIQRADHLPNNQLMLTTSTPIQKGEEKKLLTDIIPEILTPVDYPDKKIVHINTKELLSREVTYSEVLSVQPETSQNVVETETKTVLRSVKRVSINEASYEVTLWQSAQDSLHSPKPPVLADYENCEITICRRNEPKSKGLWFSMSNIMKNVVQAFLGSASNDFQAVTPSIKRSKTYDSDDEIGSSIKKMKFTDLKCRRAIHYCCAPKDNKYKWNYIDKWTQTD